MKKMFFIIIAVLFAFSSCSEINPNTQYTTKQTEIPVQFDDKITSSILNKKNELDKSENPYGVSNIYVGNTIYFNNDDINDYIFIYSLYSQFEFVIIDGKTSEYLLEERIMMNFLPSNTVCKIYSTTDNEKAIKISSKYQTSAYSEMIEIIQIITQSKSYIFNAAYDNDTGEYLHSYNEYASYNEYISEQEKYLENFFIIQTIDWDEYIIN